MAEFVTPATTDLPPLTSDELVTRLQQLAQKKGVPDDTFQQIIEARHRFGQHPLAGNDSRVLGAVLELLLGEPAFWEGR